MEPSPTPLSGGRWVPFVETWSFHDVDLTGAVFAMQLRLYFDAPGVPVVNLATVGMTPSAEGVALAYAGTATIDAHIAAGRITTEEVANGALGTDLLTLSQIRVQINETTMEGLPFTGERGGPTELAWDLHVTRSGELKQLWARGPFTVIAGATQ